MPQYLVAIHHPNNYDPSVEGEAMQRESPSTQMSNQLTRRDFAIRTAGFGLALGLTPAATLAEAQQASRSENSPAVADPYSLVDPELLPALKQFPAFDFSAEMVGKFRQTPGMPPLPAPAPQPVERHIPGPPGAPEVRLWVVDPAPSEKGKPFLLFIHGGGFMMPDPVLMPGSRRSRRIAIASSSRSTIGWLRRRAIPARLRTITPRSNGPMPMRRSSALIAPGLPWAVRARAAATRRALRFTRATETKFPSSSSCSSTPS